MAPDIVPNNDIADIIESHRSQKQTDIKDQHAKYHRPLESIANLSEILPEKVQNEGLNGQTN